MRLSRGSEAERSENEANKELRLKVVNRQQMLLRAVDVEKLIEPEPRARAIWELVGRLDLRRFRAAIEVAAGEPGRPAYDPQLLISLWIYAYSEGVSSAREMEGRCEYHPAYQWLTGLEGVNHHSLSDFRVAHQVALDELFTQVLGVLSSEGMIRLERVMHDGTKVKAAASGKSFRRQARRREHLEAARERVRQMGDPRQEALSAGKAQARERAARERVARLEQALEEAQKVQGAERARPPQSERRVSETDPEARIMKQSDGGYAPSHNLQLSTDAAQGVIVGVRVTPCEDDQGELAPSLEEVKRRNGKYPQQVVADGAYSTREDIVKAAKKRVDFFGAQGAGGAPQGVKKAYARRGVTPEFQAERFALDPETNTLTCPRGQRLVYQQAKHDRVGVRRHVYGAPAADCRACASRPQGCPTSQQGRTIVRTENSPEVAAFLEKMQTPEAQKIYRQRARVAEFTHAWLKAKIGLRQFRVRGLKKVLCETLWAALTYNLQQGFRIVWRPQQLTAPA
jgi:transposase